MVSSKGTAKEFKLSQEEILQDYRLAYRSRQVSLIGRREVLSGKAKFGIFGDGKEVAQLAMAKVFQKGDFRSGYYRDQTFMFAIDALDVKGFFAQLYAHADVEAEPATAGRAMNAHFATRMLNANGSWKNLMELNNSSADVSPTGSQMPRLVGLAYASRLYRELDELKHLTQFSRNGDEIAFGTIGNATCAEGMFWEAVNAIGVLSSPVILSIWDDEYGISVPSDCQTLHQDLSYMLSGFRKEPDSPKGYHIYQTKAWDYPALLEAYRSAAHYARELHIPAILHITEVTQPQGHSTSGSHERYKSKERLAWESEHDCLVKMRAWILENKFASKDELASVEAEEKEWVEGQRVHAWQSYQEPILEERGEVLGLIERIAEKSSESEKLSQIQERLKDKTHLIRKDIMVAIRDVLLAVRYEDTDEKRALIEWRKRQEIVNEDRYSSHLYSQSKETALNVPEIKPAYSDSSPMIYGFEILSACFDAALERDPRVLAFGEDLGSLGGVNQAFVGLQEKYGHLRVSDTGIREVTIVGQAIGLAMRGLRPIAEIQYLDYVLYALQIMSDDLATVQWRTRGGQKAPVIVRTRGHRLEGIWHSGSLMAGIIHLVRGMHVLVPRNMTQAAGFYNTLLRSDEPALVVEVLNGYRIKEKLPDNIAEFTVPLGVPEIIRAGEDVTLVTYGANCRIALEAADLLKGVGIDVEVIDVQSLLPFDIQGSILESLKKTSRIVFLDEDVPGGTTAFMLQEVIERQGGYSWLDSEPRTITAKPHRPAYGSDGDYWSKPNVESVFESVYEIMHEVDPSAFPLFYR